MAEQRQSAIVRLLPSLTDGAFLLPLFFLFTRMNGAGGLLEGDTGWHIRTGEWILANGKVPRVDMFSYTRPGEPWFAWEWLWDVMFAWLHQRWGMQAVVLASIFVICLTFALLFRLVRHKCGNPFIALAFTTLAIGGSSLHWWARPHLFTMLFAVVFLWVLELAQEGRTRLLWALPPLMVVWTNVHGGFVTGFILIGAYACGELVPALLAIQSSERWTALRKAKPYLIAALACGAATLANPYGYALHSHIWSNLRDPLFYRYVSEWQSPKFTNPIAFYFEPALVIGMAAAFWSVLRRRFGYALLLAAWAHLGLLAVRNIPIYLIVAAPIMAHACREWLVALAAAPVPRWIARPIKALERGGADFDETDRIGRVHALSAAILLLVAAVLFAPNPPEKFRAEYHSKSYPVRAMQYLSAYGNDIVVTSDEWGDYVIYSLYPRNRVFIDGRFDFYGREFTEKYLDLFKVKHGWSETVRRYGITTILLPVDAALAGALKESQHWRPVYDDGVAIIFRSAAHSPAPQLLTRSVLVNCDGGRRDRAVAKP